MANITKLNKEGYLVFKDSNKLVHRWVAKKKYGEKAIQNMEVHHIDGNKINNDKENLILVTNEDHYNMTKFESKQRFLLSVVFYVLSLVLFAFWFISMTDFLNEGALGVLVYLGLGLVFLLIAELKFNLISIIMHRKYVKDEDK